VRLTGDFNKLLKFNQKLREVPEVYKELPKQLSEHALRLTNASFRGQRDPYGAGWKANLRGGRILRKSGDLSRTVFRLGGVDQFTIGFRAKYAGVHQNGATIRAKNTRRVKYMRRKPTGRTKWRRGRGRSGAYTESPVRHRVFRKGAGTGWDAAKYSLVSFDTVMLSFKIGKKWISKESVTIPRRMMVPTRARGLPTTWATAFDRTVSKILKRHFK
jgi:phage gpG-like protein